jgi:5-methylcytosine-specific restriction endonuclease McrA
VTLKFCLDCNSHHASNYSCPKREAKRYAASTARRARGRHAWRLAREAARRRDGNACRRCGSTKALAVHHVVALANGGEQFALSNLETLCSSCHDLQHRGSRGSTGSEPALPRASNPRNKLVDTQPRPRFSRSVLKYVDDEVPFV